ncbi:MAG: 3'(2'),5'-bisphosphate nucleotidase CysQ [Alphaproteobacteria bacterium]|uniref:3'(2'),5'-bisphosphate nucleotidase CysQ n=1 Tax=Candidatus Nitrobium versatile TaxID=2884831 RepID=A0A953M0G1_9BACT|nr:3'(2'),5'-bisphosphate nucleotidase CysQ [Candidatus Nitrobium versatile]
MDSALSSYLLQSLRAALRAGEAILSVYRDDFGVSYKDDRSPLTAADRKSHEIIAAALSSGTLSPLPLLSEEGINIPYARRKRWKRFWLVDPLDGTKEFIKRNGEFTVNIALVEGNRPVAGVVYAPVPDAAYFAGRGMGAYSISGVRLSALFRLSPPGFEASGNDAPQGAERGEELMDSILSAANRLTASGVCVQDTGAVTVIGSRSHTGKEFSDFVGRLKTRYDSVEIVPAGSSLKFCLVAEGKADLYPRFGPTMEWDTAAGDIIVEEAGGRVIDAETHSELRYNKQDLLNPSFIAMHKEAIKWQNR